MALSKRPSDHDLMPPPPTKRIKRPSKVLDEEIYRAAVSHIVARDFCPALLESEAQDDYLDALRSGDRAWMDEAGRRVQEAMTPVPVGYTRAASMTPISASRAGTPRGTPGGTPSMANAQTPARHVSATPRSSIDSYIPVTQTGEKVNLNLSLNAFLATYTSEDAESFNQLLDKENARRRSKNAWLWAGNVMPSKQQRAQLEVNQKRQDRLIATSRDGTAASNQALVLAQHTEHDDRPGMIDAAHKRPDPRNSLIFQPDDFETKYPGHKSRAELAEEASRAGPKGVVYSNTRFPAEPSSGGPAGESVPASPSISAIDAAIRGQVHPSLRRGRAYADSNAPGSSELGGGETPRVNGYAFVDEEPTQAEVDFVKGRVGGEVDHETIMKDIRKAHGDEAGEGGARANPFTMAPINKREALHHAIVEKNSKAQRKTTESSTSSNRNERLKALRALGRTPMSSSANSPRITDRGQQGKSSGALTPAARALFEKIRTPKDRSSPFGEDLGRRKKGGFTPTPLRIKKRE